MHPVPSKSRLLTFAGHCVNSCWEQRAGDLSLLMHSQNTCTMSFKFFFPSAVVACMMALVASPSLAQIDEDATEKTKTLYSNLKKIQNSNAFLFGQEFFNSFRYSSGAAHGDEGDSDCNDVTGAHPALLGSDFHYYLEKNSTERGYHTDAVKWAFEQGLVITFDWHLSARNTSSYECNGAPANLAKNIANPDDETGDRDWYIAELDKAIDIINEDLRVGDDTIPIIFRPLHEMNGGWFWWGACSGLTADEYKALFQLTVSYIKERANSVLFCWSPNSPFSLDRYPGDDYVDVIGLDAYEVSEAALRYHIGLAVDKAAEADKVVAFTETGNRTNGGTNPGDDAAKYWKDAVLPAILNDPTGKARKIAWVLTWINSSWSFPYVPHAGSSAAAKQSFIEFKESAYTIFSDNIPAVYDPEMEQPSVPDPEPEPEPITSLPQGAAGDEARIAVFPSPASHDLTIQLHGFGKAALVSIIDLRGQRVWTGSTSTGEINLNINGWLNPGIYILSVTDRHETVNRKLVVK